MRKAAIASTVSLLVLGLGAARAADPDRQSFEVIERGRYLAVAADCTACHTDIGGKLFAGGRPIETPFGNIIAPNITPDVPTGIGAWTDDEFVSALRDGMSPGGTRLYPAMPYNYYTKMSREDVLAIRAYLATIEPVRNEVHSNQLPFPFDIRLSMAGWNALFFTAGEFKPDSRKSAEWNRGAYLVEGPEHCGACHTPKNMLGGDKGGKVLQGSALQGWYAPELTGDPRLGVGGWSAEEIVAYLKTGRNSYDVASGPMAEAITDSTSHLTDADLHAIAVYLKDHAGSGAQAPAPVAAQDPAMTAGEAIYIDQCAACHTMQGTGIVGLFPRLNRAPLVQQSDPASLVRVVLQGSRAVSTDSAPTGPAMPYFSWKLSDDEVAAVLTYIRNSWGNAAPPVSASTVGDARKSLRENP